MFISRVRGLDLGERVDPQYYNPDALELDRKLSLFPRVEPLANLCPAGRRITNGVRGPHHAASDCLLIRLQDCVDWEVVPDGCLTISDTQFAENRRCAVEPDDVIVAIGGYLGRAAAVTEPMKAVIGQHSAIIPANHAGPVDSRFLLAYLNSAAGEVLFQRWARGTVQAGLNLQDVEALPTPVPDRRAQRFIGGLVRQAEALRSVARSREERASSSLQALCGFDRATSFKDRPRTVSASRVSPLSLDPAFSQALEGHALMADAVDLRSLTWSYRSGDPIRADNRASGPYRYLGPSGPIDWHDTANTTGPKLIVAQDGTVGNAYVVTEPCWANNHVWVVDLYDHVDAHAVALYLSSVYPYWSGVTTGAVIPKVTGPNLMRVRLPRAVATASETVGQPFRDSLESNKLAKRLTTAARLLVEALIERKVTEAELIAAHTDPAADRSLLARLKTDGLDGDGAPLFPDLDRLFELLADLPDADQPAP